MEAFQSS